MGATSQLAPGDHTHRALHQAWWSLLLFLVSFAVAMGVGEGIAALLGHAEPSLDTTPWWVITLAVVPALLVFASPFLVVARLSNKAVAEGERQGRAPLLVAAVLVGGFVFLNLAAALTQLLS